MNHLFLAIPGPDKNMIHQLTSKIYSFIWDDKPDKLKRDLISQDYCWGGLKMINLKAFIQGLELLGYGDYSIQSQIGLNCTNIVKK